MKLYFSRSLLVLFFSALSLSTIVGQVGQTQNVQVRMVTESWGATATNSSFSARSSHVVAPPIDERKVANPRSTAATPSETGTQPIREAQSGSAQTSAAQASQVGIVFPGPSDEVPPDSQIAAGPNHLVSVVNARIEIYSKSGTIFSVSTESTFFESVGSCGCFDSRVLYDQADQRFIISTSERNFGGTSSLLVAVSQTSDPTGNWNKFAIAPDTANWYDQPTLGLSASAIYMAADVIPNNVPTNSHFDIFVIGLPELLAGSSNLSITRFQNLSTVGTITGAVTYGSSPAEFLIEISSVGTNLRMFKIDTSRTPMLTETDVAVPSYRPGPGFAHQPGNSNQLPAGTVDVESVVWRNGSLWCAHAVASDDGSSIVVRWYEIDTASAALKQSGTISGAQDADEPAITVTPDGSATVVYTTSSSTQFASAGYAHRSASDPPGAMPVSGIYLAGTVDYTVDRWGDYSGISPDPDGNSVWGIAELAQTSNTTTTAIAQILNLSSTAPDFSLSTSPGSALVKQGQSASYTVTVTAQNGFQGTVALSCTGLPANTACVFNPANVSASAASSQAQLTITTTAPKTSMVQRSVIFYAVMLPFVALLWGHLRRRKVSRILMVIVVAALTIAFQVGCGGGGSHSSTPNPTPTPITGATPAPTPMPTPTPTPPGGGTPLGSHTVVVVGTSGSLQHSSQVQLVVQ